MATTFNQTKVIRVLGVEVARVEVRNEFTPPTSKERVGALSGKELALDQRYLACVLAEAVKRASNLSQNSFNFCEGCEIEVDANTDLYSSVQYLKERFSQAGAAKVLFGFSALTSAYDKNNQAIGGVFLNQFSDILRENWDAISIPNK